MSKISFVEFFSKKLQDSVTEETRRKADAYANLTDEQIRSIPPEKFVRMPYSEENAERVAYSNYSYWGSTFRMFCKNRVAVFMLLLIVCMLVFAFIQPHIPGQKSAILINNYPEGTPNAGLPVSNQRPSSEFWFGTNSIGQDLWSNIWSGTRTSLIIGFSVAFMEAVIGTLAGVLWGYVRKLDFLFTEIYNIINNINSVEVATQEGFSAPGLSESLKAAIVMFSTIPILCIYPFLQKYFISGVTLGAVKE